LAPTVGVGHVAGSSDAGRPPSEVSATAVMFDTMARWRWRLRSSGRSTRAVGD
jgi:hypothetical protein